MKKQHTILLLLFFACSFAWSQGRYIKTTTPCDKELLLKTPGRWMPIGRFTWDKISKLEEQEILKRLDIIQKMAFTVYPEPMAYDAVQGYALHKIDFASQLKLEKTAYGINRTEINGFSTIFYEYFVKFCDYFCGRDAYEIIKGAGCETGSNLGAIINTLQSLFIPLHLDDFSVEVMRIDNRPIQMMSYLVGKWQGYDYYNPNGVSNPKNVLLHRAGQLPYIPVTRKQYLERYVVCIENMYDKILKGYEQPEGLQLLMDKKERDEQISKNKQIKEKLLKYYRDELESTTKAGLLDAPAILASGFMNMLTSEPIFSKEAVGGQMLVTENPAYFKKDLPKYIPQLIVVYLHDENDGPDPNLNPFKLYDKNFPIEKLQAMIDK